MIKLGTKLCLLLALLVLLATANNPYKGPVSDESSDIFGRWFITQIPKTTLVRTYEVEISGKDIRIFGCNKLSGSFSYDAATKNFVTSGIVAITRIGCPDNQDNVVSAAINNSKRVFKRNGFLIFEDAQGVETLRCETGKPIIVVPPVVVPPVKPPVITYPPRPSDRNGEIWGKFFAAQVAGGVLNQVIKVEITKERIFIKGCNSLSSNGFTYNPNTFDIKVDSFISTLIFCTFDQDGLVSNAIDTAAKAYNKNGVIIFEDARGSEVLRLTVTNEIPPTPPTPPTVPKIFGSWFAYQIYSGTIKNEITVEINSKEIRVIGCNNNWASFTYDAETTRFKLGDFASTRIFCEGDQDGLVTGAIKNARKAFLNKGLVVFESQQGIQLLTLSQLNLIPKPPAPPVIVDPIYVPVDVSANIFGTWFVSQASTGNINQAIEVTISNSEIRFRGCNSNWASFSYNANSKTFTVTDFASTLKFCENDPDPLISSAIRSAKRAYFKNGQVIFETAQGVEVLILSSTNPFPVPVEPVQPPYVPPVVDPIPPYVIPEVPTPIVLPGVSSTNFKGTYFLRGVGSQIATIIISFDEYYLEFEGCNVQRHPYAAYTDGVFCFLQGGAATLRSCSFDIDRNYIQLLTGANRWVKSDAGFDLYDQDRLVAKLEQKTRNKLVKYSIINGGYQLEIKAVDVSVSQGTIAFNAGCNSVSIPYQLYNGQISFGNPIQTLIFCDNDYDSVYVSAIRRGVTLKQIPEGFALVDVNGYETIRFVSFIADPYNLCRCFGGKYKLVLPNGGLRLRISNGEFTLQGCNTFTFAFSLSDNGNIVFKAPSGTKVACETDYDRAFLFSILKAQSIAVVGNDIVFFDGNNEQIVKAVNFEQSKNPNPVIDPKSPVVPIVDYFFPDGKYKFTIARSSLKGLSLTLTKGAISWRGCNIFNMKYVASTDGTIKFLNGPSTKKACAEDYDNFYVEALISAARYNEMKGMITFFDAKGKSVATFLSDFGTGAFDTQPVAPPVLPQVVTPPVVVPPVKKPEFRPIEEAIISLRGKYRFQLPKFNFDVTDNSFVFKGCNTYRIPCAYKNSNILFGKPIAGDKKCENGHIDNFFLNLIPQIFNFKKDNNVFTFFSNLAKPIFEANPIVSKKREVVPGLVSGSYQTELPAIDVDFDDNNLFLNGCPKKPLGYQAKNSGVFSASGDAQGCSAQNFDAYWGAVRESTKYRKIDNGFVLEDKDGNEKGRCLNK